MNPGISCRDIFVQNNTVDTDEVFLDSWWYPDTVWDSLPVDHRHIYTCRLFRAACWPRFLDCRQNTASGSEPRTFTRWGAPSATVLTRLNNFKNTEIKQHCSFFVQSAGLTTSRCFAESAGFFPSRLLSLGNLRAINPTHSLVVSYQGWCGWALSPMDSGKARKQEQESQEGKKVCFHSTCTWCSFSDSDVSCVRCFANFKT